MSYESRDQVSSIRALTARICEQIAILRLRALSYGDSASECELSLISREFRSQCEFHIEKIENLRLDN